MPTNILTNNIMQLTENQATTLATELMSIITDPIIIIIATLTISIYLLHKSQKKQAIFLTATILITAAIIKAAKELLQVARPSNPIILETGFSLPSGHATMAIVFFGLIAYMFTKNKPSETKITTALIATLIIATISFSRVYLRVHWLTDVIAGLILGLIILITSIQIHDKIIPSSKSHKRQHRS